LKYIQNQRRQEERVLIEHLSKLIFFVSLFSSAWAGATGDILSVSHVVRPKSWTGMKVNYHV
jgi:hypothetical protein